ncbi:helix-turn-helix transcriptional regulator [Mycobacterium sp.]|uniref:helix-turn-helix transcriptional regulator n=1 Tax=Mycobacterium sp. TaxID=1785 RepID=UPI002F3FFCC6
MSREQLSREQELRRRGVRYGRTKPDLDLDSVKRRVGNAIRELRLQAGITQKELAEAMVNAGHTTWTNDTVSRIQRGRNRTPHLDELLALSRIFGVTADDLLVSALGEPNLHPTLHPPPLQTRPRRATTPGWAWVLRGEVTALRAKVAACRCQECHEGETP